jgi:hypothetical protein
MSTTPTNLRSKQRECFRQRAVDHPALISGFWSGKPLAFSDELKHESGAGRVSEWFKEPVLKTGVRETVPWVRIPPLPPVEPN